MPPAPRGDWFSRLFGFAETSYEEAREHLKTIPANPKPNQLVVLESTVDHRRFQAGCFCTPSLAELRNRGRSISLPGRIVVSNELGDVAAKHALPENRFATFQVASQFNCLEFSNPSVTPEMGISGYSSDPTQGPACSIACGASTAFRNYFAQVPGSRQRGQVENRQLDNLHDLSKLLGNVPNGKLFDARGGYTLASDRQLAALTENIAAFEAVGELDSLRAALRIGVHAEAQVTATEWGQAMVDDPSQIVTQVFGSACSVAYSRSSASSWKAFAQLILEASYEATLWAALINAQKHNGEGGSRKVFLTCLGGGAFGNPMPWIFSAMHRAISLFEDTGLDIRIITYAGPIEPGLLELERTFDGRPQNVSKGPGHRLGGKMKGEGKGASGSSGGGSGSGSVAPTLAAADAAEGRGRKRPASEDASMMSETPQKVSNNMEDYEDLMVRVPLTLTLPIDSSLAHIREVVARKLKECGATVNGDIHKMVLAANGQTHKNVTIGQQGVTSDIPNWVPLKNFVPGSTLSLVGTRSEMQDLGHIGLCLDYRVMKAISSSQHSSSMRASSSTWSETVPLEKEQERNEVEEKEEGEEQRRPEKKAQQTSDQGTKESNEEGKRKARSRHDQIEKKHIVKQESKHKDKNTAEKDAEEVARQQLEGEEKPANRSAADKAKRKETKVKHEKGDRKVKRTKQKVSDNNTNVNCTGFEEQHQHSGKLDDIPPHLPPPLLQHMKPASEVLEAVHASPLETDPSSPPPPPPPPPLPAPRPVPTLVSAAAVLRAEESSRAADCGIATEVLTAPEGSSDSNPTPTANAVPALSTESAVATTAVAATVAPPTLPRDPPGVVPTQAASTGSARPAAPTAHAPRSEQAPASSSKAGKPAVKGGPALNGALKRKPLRAKAFTKQGPAALGKTANDAILQGSSSSPRPPPPPKVAIPSLAASSQSVEPPTSDARVEAQARPMPPPSTGPSPPTSTRSRSRSAPGSPKNKGSRAFLKKATEAGPQPQPQPQPEWQPEWQRQADPKLQSQPQSRSQSQSQPSSSWNYSQWSGRESSRSSWHADSGWNNRHSEGHWQGAGHSWRDASKEPWSDYHGKQDWRGNESWNAKRKDEWNNADTRRQPYTDWWSKS